MLPLYYDIQGLRIVGTEDEFRKNIGKISNTFFTSMLRYKDTYIFVDSLGTNWENLSQTSLWHPQQIKNLGHKNKYVVGLIKHDTLWELFLASNTGLSGQNISMFESWDKLKIHIREQWKKGFDITDLVNNDGKYYVVTSKGLNWKQSWLVESGYPEELISQAAQQGRIITDVVKLEDKYLWVFSENTGFKKQIVKFNPSTKEILKIRKSVVSDKGFQGYSLSLVREVMGVLLFVFVSG